VMFFGDLIVSFGSLFMSVALTTFWVRTVEPYDLPESLRRSRARLWVVVLLLLGGFSYVFAGCFGVKTALIAKEEIAQRRSAESADMIKALENVQRESAEGGRVENEQAGRTEE